VKFLQSLKNKQKSHIGTVVCQCLSHH